jgi:hypothetical protein
MKATIKTQVCIKCGLKKPLSEYYFRKKQQKYHSTCKKCWSNECKARYQADTERYQAKNKAWRKANREKNLADMKAYRKANREKLIAQNKTWRKANSERKKATDKAWRKANSEKVRSARKKWEKANPEKCRAKCAKRRAARLQATPAWANLKKIEEIYLNCPPSHHIDHIFPLNSPIMCGLHVESNLQYLPAKENISKGNRVSLEQQLNG